MSSSPTPAPRRAGAAAQSRADTAAATSENTRTRRSRPGCERPELVAEVTGEKGREGSPHPGVEQQGQAERRTRDHGGFDHRRSEEAEPVGTQRPPDRRVALAGDRPGEEEASHVRAGQEEKESDQRHETDGDPVFVPHQAAPGRCRGDPESRARHEPRRPHPARNRGEVFVDALERDTRPGPGEHGGLVPGPQTGGNPDVGVVGEPETGGKHADDRVRHAVEEDLRPHRPRARSVLPAPERVRDQGHARVPPAPDLFGREVPARPDRDPELGLEPSRRPDDTDALGGLAARDRGAPVLERDEPVEDTVLRTDRLEAGGGRIGFLASSVRRAQEVAEPDQPSLPFDRQRLEEDDVDDREDGRVRADPDRESQDRRPPRSRDSCAGSEARSGCPRSRSSSWSSQSLTIQPSRSRTIRLP